MSKQSGLGDNLYVDAYDLSGDVGALSRIAGGPNLLPSTGINKLAMERMGGVRDSGIEYMSYFNDDPGQSHPVHSALPTVDRIVTYFRGTALGSPAASQVSKQINYDGTRGADGGFTLAVQALGNGSGLEWGKQLTVGKRVDTTATNGTGVDFSTGSALFGAQFYLHVFAFTGTNVTIKIQESSDNGAGDAFADVTGGGFTLVTGVGAQRIATAAGQTVERYLRVVTSGTFSSVTFAVNAIRNDTLVVL